MYVRFRELRADSELSGIRPALYSPEKFAMEKRKLQVLMGEFNAMLKWAFWGLQITILSTATFATVAAVTSEEGRRKVHMAVTVIASMAIFASMYTKLASVHDYSKDVLFQWRQCRRERAWIWRFLRSTPPVSISLGSYFIADKGLVLTSLSIVAENSVSLLVSRRS